MKNKGWVKLWREQFNNWVSERKPWCDGYAWCYLYSQANHKDGSVNFGTSRNEYIDIKRGQFITSKLKLGKIFGWGRHRVDSFINALKSTNMITYETSNRYILVTIVNYEIYQQIGKLSNNETNNETNSQRTTSEHKQECKEHIYREREGKKLFLDSIYLTNNEYEKLISEYGKEVIEKKIEDLQRYIAKSGKKYSSHYLTIKAWIRKEEREPEFKNEKFDSELPESNTIDLRKELGI